MNAGKITAKLRDAVPVCLMVNGEEVMRYKNIELPDAIKELEMLDFRFNVPLDGKITFEIHFAEGVLPEVFPEARTRVSRAAKASGPAIQQADETPEEPPETPAAVLEAEAQPAEAAEKPDNMELHYNVTGIPRKELVVAVSEFTGVELEYKAAPSFAYEIGAYTVDKDGTLTGPTNLALAAALQRQGFTAAE